jgi:Smg protein
MFEVLNYVCTHLWHDTGRPELPALEHQLKRVGFSPDQVGEAMTWLGELQRAARGPQGDGLAWPAQQALPATRAAPLSSLRVYTRHEQYRLGAAGLGFIHFLEAVGALPMATREIVIERAVAVRGAPLALGDLKTIVLMVYRSLGQQPDALILDELCQDHSARVAH